MRKTQIQITEYIKYLIYLLLYYLIYKVFSSKYLIINELHDELTVLPSENIRDIKASRNA